MIQVMQMFQSDTKPINAKEFVEFWESLTSDEQTHYLFVATTGIDPTEL